MPKQGFFITAIAVIFTVTSCLPLSVSAQVKTSFVDYFEHFSFEQNLSQGSANCMMRGPKGYLWVGTQGGLNRFNGIEFQSYLADGSTKNPPGNWITGCAQDEQGYLWFATKSAGITRYNTHTDTFKFFNKQSTSTITDDRFNSLYFDQKQFLWAGSADGVLYRINPTTAHIDRFINDDQSVGKVNAIISSVNHQIWLATSTGLFYLDLDKGRLFSADLQIDNATKIQSEIWTLSTDQNGQLWIGAKTGLYKLSKVNEQLVLEKSSLNTGWVTAITERIPGELWINTYGSGLYVYDTISGDFQQFTVNKNNENSIKNNYLLSLFLESDQDIWLGTDGKGLHRYSVRRSEFNHTTHIPDNSASLSHAFVRAISKDKNGNLWVGTRGGLNKRPANQKQFLTYQHQKSNIDSLPNDNVFAIHTSTDNSVWVGTYGGGLAKYNAEQDNFERFTEASGLPTNYIFSITSSSDNTLWLGTNKGLVHFDPKTEHIRHFSHQANNKNSLSQNTVVALLDDGKDTLWVATFLGLNRFNKQNQTFTQVQKGPEGLSDNMVTALYKDDRGNLWIGTMNGLNRLQANGKIKQYGVEHGLPNANVFGIYQGDDNQLWLSTNNGLAAYNYDSETFKHFNINDGVQDRSFILGAHFADAQGALYFGGVNGFNYFKPSKLTRIQTPPTTVLESFYIFNSKVDFGDLNHRTTDDDAISLGHQDSVFGIEFSTPRAFYQEKVEYAYRLVGFDNKWLTTDVKNRVATFTNIPAGSYQLQVKAKYPDTEWGEISSIKIEVNAAPWLTKWAISAYLAVVIAIILGFVQLYRKKQRAEQDKQLANMMNSAKDELLANVSHEFKTPLTLILGPTNELLQTSQGKVQQQLQGIKRNAQKLNVLVDNILNEKQISSSELGGSCNISDIASRLVEDMQSLAHANNQQLQLNLVENVTLFVELSPEKTELILGNLVSNAIKYAGKNTKIQVKIQEIEGKCVLSVNDNGLGILPNEQEKIFERNFRAANVNGSGHGLGLAIVKGLVDQAGGSIRLQSNYRHGATFTVELPIAYELKMADVAQQNPFEENTTNKKLLIIDDNDEIRRYLNEILSVHFCCKSSVDGASGIQVAQEWQPDVIISDVMMPKMNGLELLHTLRTSEDISHIPVLMLSAYPSKALKLKTLTLLADDFLPKPFTKQEVLATLNNILSIRAMSQQKALQSIQYGEVEAVPLIENVPEAKSEFSAKDQKFVEQINVLLQRHYADVDFTLSDLAKAMFMSERNLQIKTKALFGVSPVDLIKDVRLHNATVQLTQSALSIGEIAQLNGFNSQSYFSKCFKDKYDVTPNVYRKKQIAV